MPDNGEGALTEAQAKARANDVLGRPEHVKPKGSAEDQATRDDQLDDPAHQEGDE